MPVLTVGGEKKKVACGPCIRGHRSSKCAHKDRVLIEVRKPGRPLGTCPHPAGSCGCERVVINYMIPKDRAGSSISQGLSPASAASSRVQKASTAPRSVANLPQATVEKVLSGDTAALAVLANYPSERISTSSDTSSQPPSVSSSASATPTIDALKERSQPEISIQLDEQLSTVQTPRDYSNGLPLPNVGIISPSSTADLPSQSKSCCCSSSTNEMSSASSMAAGRTAHDVPSMTQAQQIPGQAMFQTFSANQTRHFPPKEAPSYVLSPAFDMSSSDFPSFELAIGCGGMQPAANSMTQRIMGYESVDCACGDTCQCFACMTHPSNRTTVDYVRYHNELLAQTSYLDTATYGPSSMLQAQRPMFNIPHQFILPQQSHEPHLMAMHGFAQSNHHQPVFPSHQLAFSAHPVPSNPVPHTPVSELQNLHFPLYEDMLSPDIISSGQSLIPTQAYDESQSPSSNANANASTATPFSNHRGSISLSHAQLDADSPIDEDVSTLSPSSFLVQQFTIPGCDDITGTCQCGEGCDCPGCLTHSGHATFAPESDHKPTPAELDNIDSAIDTKIVAKSCCS